MLTAEKEIDSCCNPTNKDGEHGNTSYVSVCVPPSVEFVVTIIVQLLKRFFSFRYCSVWNCWQHGIIFFTVTTWPRTNKYCFSLYHRHLKLPQYILLVLNCLNELSDETTA